MAEQKSPDPSFGRNVMANLREASSVSYQPMVPRRGQNLIVDWEIGLGTLSTLPPLLGEGRGGVPLCPSSAAPSPTTAAPPIRSG